MNIVGLTSFLATSYTTGYVNHANKNDEESSTEV